jgi:hypothetical protein
MRGSWIAAVAQVRASLPSLSAEQQELMSPSILLWGERMRLLVFDVGVSVWAVLALLSPRSTAFFEAAALARGRGPGQGHGENP